MIESESASESEGEGERENLIRSSRSFLPFPLALPFPFPFEDSPFPVVGFIMLAAFASSTSAIACRSALLLEGDMAALVRLPHRLILAPELHNPATEKCRAMLRL